MNAPVSPEEFSRARTSQLQRRPPTTQGLRGLRWTSEQLDLLLKHWPDTAPVMAATGRSHYACAQKAQALGLRRKNNAFSVTDRIWLRANWHRATRPQILARFPGRTYDNIAHKAKSMGLAVRGMPPPVTSGHPLVDAIRVRAHERGLTMKQLDTLAGTGTYWQGTASLTCDKRYTSPQMTKTVAALGGYVCAVWDDA